MIMIAIHVQNLAKNRRAAVFPPGRAAARRRRRGVRRSCWACAGSCLHRSLRDARDRRARRPRAPPRASPPARPAAPRRRPALRASVRRTGTSGRPARRPAKPSSGLRCRQIVALHAREDQERIGHHRAHDVHSRVFGTGVATAVAIRSRSTASRRMARARLPTRSTHHRGKRTWVRPLAGSAAGGQAGAGTLV